ncbi:MAG: PASTA domain-containing protein [Armatimonadetes bacterium]|nr:PASTA domain-containing protein [Armatimonadota bacterium]
MYLPRPCQENYRVGNQLVSLGICQRFEVAPKAADGQLLRLELCDLSAMGLSHDAMAEIERRALQTAVAVHPHLSRSLARGREGTTLWNVETGASLNPLATHLRILPDMHSRVRVILDLWEALAYIHGLGLPHGCLCPGTLWAGASGGMVSGLSGVGAVAGVVGRSAVLQSPREAEQERRFPAEDGDVHDLAQTLSWIGDWPSWLEEILLGAQAHPRPAGQVAAVIEEAASRNLRTSEMRRTRHSQKVKTAYDDVPLGAVSTMGGLLQTFVRGLVSVAVTGIAVFAAIALAVLLALGPAPELRTVPDLVGMTPEEAKARAAESQLGLKVTSWDFSTTVDEGRILRTDPYPGKVVRAGREVRATVSRGRREAKVPELKGLSLATATEKLTALNLEVGETRREASSREVDTVLSQSPPPAKVLPRNGKVDLVLSGGPDFGTLRTADGKTYVFRTVSVTVPRGKDLQLVSVEVDGQGFERSFEDQLCRPGETLRVDVYGPRGARLRVKVEDERVYSRTL